MKAICKRELRTLMSGFRGWGYVAIVLLGAALSVLMNNLVYGATQFERNAMYIALSMIPATALASADAFQAEKRQHTERLLYSLPFRNSSIVMGKLLAHFAPVAIAALGLCVFPAALTLMGSVALTSAYVSILALFLLGVACMSVSLCVSACVNGRGTAIFTTIAILMLSWAAPYVSAQVNAMSEINVWMLVGSALLIFVVFWRMSGSVLIGTVIAAFVEAPALLACRSGNSADVLNYVAAGIRRLSLFEGLNPFINGLLDGSVLVMWVAVSAFMVCVMILYIGNRRQTGRRVLS